MKRQTLVTELSDHRVNVTNHNEFGRTEPVWWSGRTEPNFESDPTTSTIVKLGMSC